MRWTREGFSIWMSGTWSERAVLFSGGNKYCHHQREMLHLFNVPFRKRNPCIFTDMVTSWCVPPLWNLIRAKNCLLIFGAWHLLKMAFSKSHSWSVKRFSDEPMKLLHHLGSLNVSVASESRGILRGDNFQKHLYLHSFIEKWKLRLGEMLLKT